MFPFHIVLESFLRAQRIENERERGKVEWNFYDYFEYVEFMDMANVILIWRKCSLCQIVVIFSGSCFW